MSERPPDDSIENELERTLAEELDHVSPRRDLWTAIEAGVQPSPPRRWRRWLIPALGSLATLLVVALVAPLVLNLSLGSPLASAPDAPIECFDAESGQLASVPCSDGAAFPEVATPSPTPRAGALAGEMKAASEPFVASGCSACHTIDSVPQARGQIGPNLSRVGAKGADYIRESIVNPNAVIAAACPDGACASGVMPQNFGLILTPEEIDAIVAFLLEQR